MPQVVASVVTELQAWLLQLWFGISFADSWHLLAVPCVDTMDAQIVDRLVLTGLCVGPLRCCCCGRCTRVKTFELYFHPNGGFFMNVQLEHGSGCCICKMWYWLGPNCRHCVELEDEGYYCERAHGKFDKTPW